MYLHVHHLIEKVLVEIKSHDNTEAPIKACPRNSTFTDLTGENILEVH